jgi:hypothetical protein
MLRVFALLVAVAALGACQSSPPQYEDHLWVRTDGRPMSEDAVLKAQGELDLTICVGEVQKSAVGAPIIYYQGLAGAISAAMIADQRQAAMIDILRGCMAGRGYVLVPRSQAAAVAAGFRARG